MHNRASRDKIMVGWREWIALPGLGIDAVKAKIDTGARTSALRTFSLETFRDRGVKTARFGVHPYQRTTEHAVWCQAPIADERNVRDSGGHREWRYVIVTDLKLGEHRWPIELTLTAHDTMLFRMLVGRTAMTSICVDPAASFLAGSPSGKRPAARASKPPGAV